MTDELNPFKTSEEEEAKVAKEEAKAKAEDVKVKKEVEKKECLAKATVILEEYNGAESNIPLGSEYWSLMNRYRGL